MSDSPVLAALPELRTSMTDRLDAMAAGLQQLEGRQDRLRVDLMGCIDGLQDQLTTLRDDVAVNFGRADKAEEVANGTRRELRALSDMVNAMERQIQRLQTDVRHLKGEP